VVPAGAPVGRRTAACGLDGSTVGDSLIGIDGLVGLLTVEEVGDHLLDLGDTGRATDEDDLVSIVWEDVDLNKMKALLDSPEGKAAEAAHTVIDPIEIYIEVEGGK